MAEQQLKKGDPINIKMNIIGGKGGVIPPGVIETLKISIIDEFASFHFNDGKITEKFSESQNFDGVETKYNQRTQWAVSHYPKMNQKELLEHITLRLNQLKKPKQ